MKLISSDTDDRRWQAKANHDAMIALHWRSMYEDCDVTLKQFFEEEMVVTDDVELAIAFQQHKTIRWTTTRFGISEQIPKEWQDKRQPLMPLYKEAKNQGIGY